MDFGKIVATIAAAGLFTATLAGCSDAMEQNTTQIGSSSDDGGRRILSPGKADNYWSDVSREYEMQGTIGVEMTSEEFEDEAKRNQKISRRLTAVGLYLTAYMTAKLDDLFDNTDYGGFKSMVRNHSVEREDVSSGESGTYRVEFTIDVAGPPDLMERLRDSGAESADGGVEIGLEMPKGATSDPESIDRNVPRDFDPNDYDGELETVDLEVSPLPELKDSYPHYGAFVRDGTYDITVFFGHDYNEDRWDLRTAEEVHRMLENRGFEAPAPSFDALEASSGPFTKTVRASGIEGAEQFEIEVRLYHADMFEGRRDAHKQKAIDALRTRDVFYYWGHAGPYFGFSLGPNSRADIGYREIRELDLNDKKQLVIASGCQTYSQYADMLFANPAKSEENLDVITTVNYSNLVAGDAILGGLVEVAEEQHAPKSFYELVEQVNAPAATRRMDTFYGVIGIDGNPRLHPYANADAIGTSCETASDCGAHGDANVCVDGSCAVRALAEGSCPAEAQFGYLGDGRQVESGVCH